MSSTYDPRVYWDARLARHDGLRGTGHISFGESYNRWLYQAKERALSRALGSRPLQGSKVLDVGCGTGYFVRWYRRRGATVTGVDISGAGIDRLRAELPGEYHVMDVTEAQDRPLGAFEIVNVWDVLYHVVDDARFEQALSFVASNVAPGGLLLITDRLAAPGDVRIAEHVRMRCLQTYERLLSGSGLVTAGQLFLYKWLNRYVSLPPIDSKLGALYYWLDGRETKPQADNLSLGVWRRIASS